MNHNSGKLIIGLTGSLGSGCTTLSQALEKAGFKRVSISQPIKNKFRELHEGKDPTRDSYGPDWRAELQDIGDRGRKGKFADLSNSDADHRAYWIELALQNGGVQPGQDDIVIDGIRNLGEMAWLRKEYPYFWLVAAYADYETRWERLKTTGAYPNETVFQRDDRRDSGEGSKYGQNVQKCVYEADYVFKNVKNIGPPSKLDEVLAKRLTQPLEGMRGEKKDFRGPLHAEVFMATAVSQSHASQCLKRKVGALIVNEETKIPLSLGYNENPVGTPSCFSLDICYKDKVMESRLEKMVPFFCPDCGTEHTTIKPPYVCNGKGNGKPRCRCNFKQKFFPSRGIELCTAIHAEERAILSLAGRSADGYTLYVNTFPCFQCARHIKNAGIKKVVYVEAYPIKEAVDFLTENGIEIEPFEGFKP